ncbi:hypothetical protein SCHPADRAFT_993823 [Schizopora paradoxa]|uniref:RRN7-type domain-containing protein n=1 Tax=Schizopora paradoxa TaxID=27342 RepID=A0A0H2SLS1_9AGAM|nr:hypothetical protein SCHPADRAFT_993823 [Schizopora paradoxa]
MAFKKRCKICGSRKWRKSPDGGIIICSEGHVLQEYRNETNETGEISKYQTTKRTTKRRRVKRERKSRANPMLYHGDRARFHYFQCLQLLLRMQVKALIDSWHLPPEFETVCRDFWALHLSLLSNPPPAEPFLHLQDENPPPAANVDDVTKENSESSDSDSDSDSSSSSSSESEREDAEDPGLADLMREASESDTSNDEEDEADTDKKNVAASAKHQKRRSRQHDHPAGNLAVILCACWSLRVPLIYQDLVRLIDLYKLPYLDPLRLFPDELTKHLTKHTKQALSPHKPPTPIFLHTITARLAGSLFSHYEVSIPEFNAAPVLWRAVRHMGGNPVLYTLAKTLARYLEIPLTLNARTAPSVANVRGRNTKSDPTQHRKDNVPPEVALVTTVIIALKIVYGFHGTPVYPRDNWDPAWTMPSLEAYLTLLRTMDNSGSDDLWAYAGDTPAVQAGDDSKLDTYLAFCERALLPHCRSTDAHSKSVGRESSTGFPESDNPRETARDAATSTARRAVYPSPSAVHGEESEKARRPGEQHAIYSSQDILGTLPDEFATVVGHAARWVGVNGEELLAVMEKFERRLVRRWSESERKEKEDHNDGDEQLANDDIEDLYLV